MLPNDTNQITAQPAEPAVMPATTRKRTSLYVSLVVIVLAAVAAALYLINPGGIFTWGTPSEPALVKITANGFVPQTVKIKKGQAVEWVNDDSTAHQVASDPYPDHSTLPHLFAEDPLAKGESFSYTFDDAGTFTYNDNLKPAAYHGTVVVE